LQLQFFARGASWGVLFFGAVTLLGCSAGMTVKVDYDDKANFAALRSFGFKDSQDPSKVEQLVKEAVQRQLLSKGYTLHTGPERPDFQVTYHAATQKKTIWQRQYSPRGVPTGVVPITFEEGTIAIQMLDPKTEKVIWTGQVAEAVDNQTQAIDDINPEVNKILTRFPPR